MSKQPLSFGKTILASGLGMVLASVVIGIIGFFLMLGTIAAFSKSPQPEATKANTFLKIDLTQAIPERTPSELQNLFSEEDAVGLTTILKALSAAENDKNILGAYLYMGSGTMQSWGQCEELRIALENFKKAGKTVVAYADSYSQTGYYIATISDHVMMGAAGQVDLRGIAAQPIFYKDLLDKWDIHMDLIRPKNNAYKSAGETYTMNHMSEANKEQIRAYITSIWNHVSQQIAESRHYSVDEVNTLADNLVGYIPQQAYTKAMVDTLCFEYDARQLMKDRYHMDKLEPINKYAQKLQYTGTDQIAVIYAEGDVLTGRSNGFTTAVYGDDVAKAFDDAAKDTKIKAIVLRVNSPGGAVLASETMTAAIKRAKSQKPVIVSMSDVAASAGYEISCYATKIVALPTTLTGSIGVFASIPEIGTALKKHLGITTDTVMTNHNAGAINGMRPMSTQTREVMQRNIEDFYHTFISRVSEGRNIPVEKVDEIARGRVWTGAEAINIGLVDTLGSFATAIELAAQEAEISNYVVIDYPREKDLMTQIIELKTPQEAKLQSPLDELTRWANMEPLQARLPFILNIQ